MLRRSVYADLVPDFHEGLGFRISPGQPTFFQCVARRPHWFAHSIGQFATDTPISQRVKLEEVKEVGAEWARAGGMLRQGSQRRLGRRLAEMNPRLRRALRAVPGQTEHRPPTVSSPGPKLTHGKFLSYSVRSPRVENPSAEIISILFLKHCSRFGWQFPDVHSNFIDFAGNLPSIRFLSILRLTILMPKINMLNGPSKSKAIAGEEMPADFGLGMATCIVIAGMVGQGYYPHQDSLSSTSEATNGHCCFGPWVGSRRSAEL